MKNNGLLLLKTLLLSTSQWNIYRYTKDKKKKKKIVGAAIGAVMLYLMLMAYCIAMCAGYGAYGIIHAAPVLCALLISLLASVCGVGAVFVQFLLTGSISVAALFLYALVCFLLVTLVSLIVRF